MEENLARMKNIIGTILVMVIIVVVGLAYLGHPIETILK